MTDPRSEIFEAVRKGARKNIFSNAGNIQALDNLLDTFGVARVQAPVKAPVRRINDAGLRLIKDFEGRELEAHKDPVGIWTIGYGSTGPHVAPGMKITEAEAEALLRDDLDRFERAVAAMAPVATDNQFAAMVSLAFNVGEGEGGFKSSTLRRKHNEGDYDGAANEFARWNKAAGKVLGGLTRRRAAEAALYKS